MRKIFFGTACAVAFVLPVCALAAFAFPSDILPLLASRGRPQEFAGKFFMEVGEGADSVRFSGTMRSMSEGQTLQDMKSSVTVTVTAEMTEGKFTGTVDMMVFQKKLYVRLSDASMASAQASAEDAAFGAMMHRYQNRWFVMNLSEATEAFTEDGEFALTAQQWQREIAVVLDTLFTLEHTRFKEGHSYLLTLNPAMWAETLATGIDALETMNENLADELSSEKMLPVLATGAEAYANAFNVRIKVDTNNAGEFRFARIYATMNLPEEDTPVSLSIEGSLQHRPKPVYLEIPKKTEPLEEEFGEWTPFFLNIGPGLMEENEWMDSDDEQEPAVQRPLPLPVPSAKCSPDGSVRGSFIGTQELCPGGRESRRSLRRRLED